MSGKKMSGKKIRGVQQFFLPSNLFAIPSSNTLDERVRAPPFGISTSTKSTGKQWDLLSKCLPSR